jgi:hypothetical protein
MPAINQHLLRARLLIKNHKQRFAEREPLQTAESLRAALLRKTIVGDTTISQAAKAKILRQLDEIILRHTDAALALIEQQKK